MAFSVPQQVKNNWCWAAVCVAVAHYFDPKSKLDQPGLVGKAGKNPQNDETAKLQDALPQIVPFVKSVALSFPKPTGQIGFGEIEREIDACRPVCVRIKCGIGLAHFLVIWGCGRDASGSPYVQIGDPNAGSTTLYFDQLRLTWTNTYLVQVQKGKN